MKKYFPIRTGLLNRVVGHVKAVDDVSFGIRAGETFGLVGESGCGKSTLARVLLNLKKASGGEIRFGGQNIQLVSSRELRALREEMQIIFQDPYGSLNPRFLVRDLIGEPLRVHRKMTNRQVDERVIELMELVGLDVTRRNHYPHEFSGGQRQRIGIARAIALNPRFIVADEAVSALDVSVQSQVLNLLMKLQKELGLTYLFIAHGLQCGTPYIRSGRCDVPGENGGGRENGGVICASAASLHGGAAICDSAAYAAAEGREDYSARRCAISG